MDNIAPELQEIVGRYRNQLEKLGIRISAIFLFGSWKTGTNREGSDIDLIVVSSDFSRMGLRKRLEILGVAAARILEPIEAYGVTPEEIEKNAVPAFWAETLKKESVKV
jgi:predicted nucleotidyltransferase